jgi:ketosteroid isomerase-like protein
MDIPTIKQVMKRYGSAWQRRDTNLLLSCFTKNGIYQESPLAKPYKGHQEISNFWDTVVVNETQKITFKLKRCYLCSDGKTGFAEWECKNKYRGEQTHMAGIMLLKMKGDKISYLNEYWNTRKTQ